MISVAVTQADQVAEARRLCVELSARHGFGEEASGRVAIVATELATNLVKHGGGGQIVGGVFDDRPGEAGIELIGIDKGTGIADIGAALSDGVSTAGTAGNGLGAIKRQSNSFEIFSQVGQGTIVVSRLLASPGYAKKGLPISDPRPAAISVPYPGETVCGDGWAARASGSVQTIMVIDGLGHGPDAAKVSTEALRLFDRYWSEEPAEIIRCFHAGLRSTRGGAVAVARIDPQAKCVTYSGVGNISGAICLSTGETRRMMSYNGTIGHNARNVQQLQYSLDRPEETMVVMHSDGIGTSWSAGAYPGLIGRPPILLASVLYRDFCRGRDDATILVARGSLP
jgi:anti-sigma regulatory factor (Ser/Thr protein kinase)